MNEVIVNSLSKLRSEDVRAMAVYLKSLPAAQYVAPPVPANLLEAGEPIYKARCEKCHGSSGRGSLVGGPPLAGSPIVQAQDPASLFNIILYGPETPKEVSFGAWETMPSYATVLGDAEIAAVSNWVRANWGNQAGAVGAQDVQNQR